jgi:hypothetical protein
MTVIGIRDDEELREKVRTGADDPLGWIDAFTCGGTNLTGDDEEGMKEYLTSFFQGLLQSLEACDDGERAVFATGNGPIYVVLEPLNEEDIHLWFCHRKDAAESGEEPEPYEPAVTIAGTELAGTVVDVATEFLNIVRDVNSELASNSYAYQGLQDDINTVRERYDLD